MTTTQATATQIRSIALEFAPLGEWVSLTDLRACLPEVPREDMDAALKDMNREDRLEGGRMVSLVPESVQSALRPEDRAAAIQTGGQAKHYLRLTR